MIRFIVERFGTVIQAVRVCGNFFIVPPGPSPAIDQGLSEQIVPRVLTMALVERIIQPLFQSFSVSSISASRSGRPVLSLLRMNPLSTSAG